MSEDKKILTCPYCGQMSIKKYGTRGINKQRYMCKNKNCKKSFTIETAESEALKRKLINDRLKRNLGLLTCPKCGSKDVILNGKRTSTSFDNEYMQRYLCKTCNKSYTKKSIEKLNRDSHILNSYLGFVDNRAERYEGRIDPWFTGKIANRLGIKVGVLNRIIKKNEDIVYEHYIASKKSNKS